MAEAPGADQAIARLPGASCAFVGRALRGPVNRPVTVRGYAEYQHVFGGLWQPSPMSYAVEQFFENGGTQAVIVRVANGARPATLSLPCGAGTLTLEARSPGTREALRASVDYDNIGPGEDDRFNLVIQRVRTQGSEHVEDQEIFRRLSVAAGTARFVSTALQESSLVRVRGSVPGVRPDRSCRAGSRNAVGYVDSNPDGDDGEALTDYDLIGSAVRGTGMFALRACEDAHFVCIPPPARDRDLGPGVLVAAEALCRELKSLLVVDPPAAWENCEQVVAGLRDLGFRSDHALMCYPRLIAWDRLRGRHETFANCGAVAGALTRLDDRRSPWSAGPDEELLLRPGMRPLLPLGDADRARLVAHGVNPLQSVRTPGTAPALRTLAGDSAEGSLLTRRRRALLVLASIERGTRWSVFHAADRATWRRLERQVRDFLAPLATEGLFGEPADGDDCWVICDERVNSAQDSEAGRVNLLVGLRGARPGEFVTWMVSHAPEGSRVRPVRTRLLPPGLRMTVHGLPPEPVEAAPAPARTVAQELYGYYRDRRPDDGLPTGFASAVAATAGRRDLDAVARFYRDFRGGGQRF
ncbi:MAG: hypothetical protein U1F08_01945 [Steroidobacteraceae bacterium]